MYLPIRTVAPSETSHPDELAEHAIGMAESCKRRGQYEDARLQLSRYWTDVGAEPNLSGIAPLVKSDLLTMIGALTRELARARRISTGNAIACELMRRAECIADALGDDFRRAAAVCELGFTLSQLGKFEEAREQLAEAARLAGAGDDELLATIKLRAILVEGYDLRRDAAFRLAAEWAYLFDENRHNNLTVIGSFYNIRSTLHLWQHDDSGDTEDLNLAFIDSEAARHYFELAGHTSYQATALNNLALIMLRAGKLEAAADHSRRALAINKETGDVIVTGQIEDTLARIYMEANQLDRAERHARSAEETFIRTNSTHLLKEVRAVLSEIQRKRGDSSAITPRHTQLRIVHPTDQPTSNGVQFARPDATISMFPVTLADDDFTLVGRGHGPGSELQFDPDVRPEEGQLCALFHLREQANYIGFYHGDPHCYCHRDDQDRPQRITTLFYDDGGSLDFQEGVTVIIGTHPTLTGSIH